MIRKAPWIAVAAWCTLSAAELPYAGKWLRREPDEKTKKANPSSANTIELSQNGSDGLTVKIAALNAVCEAKFDGKDYPAIGPTVPPGYTLAIRKIDARSFEMIQKVNGKALYTSTFATSPDGKTLTETDSANTVGEKVKILYERR
jgi:hypothetical protein